MAFSNLRPSHQSFRPTLCILQIRRLGNDPLTPKRRQPHELAVHLAQGNKALPIEPKLQANSPGETCYSFSPQNLQ